MMERYLAFLGTSKGVSGTLGRQAVDIADDYPLEDTLHYKGTDLFSFVL